VADTPSLLNRLRLQNSSRSNFRARASVNMRWKCGRLEIPRFTSSIPPVGSIPALSRLPFLEGRLPLTKTWSCHGGETNGKSDQRLVGGMCGIGFARDIPSSRHSRHSTKGMSAPSFRTSTTHRMLMSPFTSRCSSSCRSGKGVEDMYVAAR
jgi:hypothetical protein